MTAWEEPRIPGPLVWITCAPRFANNRYQTISTLIIIKKKSHTYKLLRRLDSFLKMNCYFGEEQPFLSPHLPILLLCMSHGYGCPGLLNGGKNNRREKKEEKKRLHCHKVG